MDRRTFIQNTILGTGGLFLQSHTPKREQAYSLVMVRGGSPGVMLDVGLEILGTMGRFVQKGQTVLIKPTMQWNLGPESGANTNPDLLAKLVKQCYWAGSKEVFLLDQTKDKWKKCYKNSGIERAVKDAGAKMLKANRKKFYHEVEIPNAKVMKKAKVHEAALEAGLIINVPAVKPDPNFGFFGAFQNLMPLIWDYGKIQGQMEQCMIDFLHFRKPVLNIMDIHRVQQNGSPPEIKEYKTLILSPDIVSAETFSAQRLGVAPDQLKYLELAEEAGFGQMEPPKESMRSIILKNNQTGK